MRVLLLNSRLSERGGAHRWLLGVAAHLQGRAQTLLAVAGVDRSLPDAERSRVGRWVGIKGLDGRGLGGSSRAAAARLERLIADFEPDVVHANDVTDPLLLEVVVACGRGMQTVQDHRFFCPGRGKVDAEERPCHDPMGESCLRCFDDAEYGHRVLALTRRRLVALQGMARVTVLSRYIAGELQAAGIPAERIVCIPPFVDNLLNGPAGDHAPAEFHLMAGRLAAHKGVRVALDAARALRGDLPLVVAGDGPLADVVREESRQPASKVRYVGWADRAKLRDLLRRARSLWLPAIWAEPFGIACLEAMACGVPVIASDGGGVSDWLTDGATGLLVRAGSSSDVARAADRLAADPQQAHALGERGRERVVRDYEPGASMRRLCEVYAQVRHAAVSSLSGSGLAIGVRRARASV